MGEYGTSYLFGRTRIEPLSTSTSTSSKLVSSPPVKLSPAALLLSLFVIPPNRTSRRVHAQVVCLEFGIHDGLCVAVCGLLFLRHALRARVGGGDRGDAVAATRGMETTASLLGSSRKSHRQRWTAAHEKGRVI